MKSNLRKKIMFIILIIFYMFCDGENYKYKLINNPKGWNLPKISNMKKESINYIKLKEKDINIYVESYKPTNLMSIIQKRISSKNKIEYSEELRTYQLENIHMVKIFKDAKKNKNICYLYSYEISSENADLLFRTENINYKTDYEYTVGGVSSTNFGENIIFDIDEDGIYETLINSYGIVIKDYKSQASEMIDRILSCIIDYKRNYKNSIDKNEMLSSKLLIFKSEWIKYLDFPSKINAKKVLTFLKEYKYKKYKDMANPERKMWEWILETTYILEKEVYASEKNAVRTAFRLLPISFETLSGNLDLILDRFIRVNPKLFLEELKVHRNIIKLKWVLLGNIGYKNFNRIALLHLEAKKKIEALEKVKDPSLIELRDECIKYIKNSIITCRSL